jgi:hypothetical protein
MVWRIALAANVEGSPSAVYDILRSTNGQQGFWTSDCALDEHHGRFSFAQAPVDLNVSISLVADELVRMKVDAGFPGWVGSTWEWSLSANPDSPVGRLHGPVVGDDPRSTGALREERHSRSLLRRLTPPRRPIHRSRDRRRNAILDLTAVTGTPEDFHGH